MPPKVVVFDLDETLGYFFQLGQLWELLSYFMEYNKQNETLAQLSQKEFTELLNLYPEFLRPNIISILNYLKHKKEKRQCTRVMLYTNNQAPRSWATLIVEYLNNKINYGLFDQIISAFKVNGKRIEMCRTTHEKTVDDFIRCTKLPENTEICFLDDVHHPEMVGDNVYYIKVNPYVYNLPFYEVIDRFLKSTLGTQIVVQEKGIHEFRNVVGEYMKRSPIVYVEKTKEEYEIDKIVSKKTMVLLQDFFKTSWHQGTHKTYTKIKNKRNATLKRSN
jgi:hypothetical protein